MRGRLSIAILLTAMLAAAVSAAGGRAARPQTILHTRQTVVALALDGSDVAWLGGRPSPGAYGLGCDLSLRLLRAGKTALLPLPYEISHTEMETCTDVSADDSVAWAALALGGGDVAWILVDSGGNNDVVSEGASSEAPRRTVTLVRMVDDPAGWLGVPPSGLTIGGVAAVDGVLALGKAHIAYREILRKPPKNPPLDFDSCDIDPNGLGCRTRVDGGGVYTWSGGAATRLPSLPPSLALAGAGDLLAVATMPVGPWRHGEARVGEVQVRDGRGRVVTRVPAPQSLVSVALSQHLLAVEGNGLSVYEVPSGRLLRPVRMGRTSWQGMAAVGHSLVLWDSRRVVAFDPWTGSRRTIVALPPRPASETAFSWTVTAVAVDGNRLAWAQTTPVGNSVVYAVDLG